jgi:hypothetical protein
MAACWALPWLFHSNPTRCAVLAKPRYLWVLRLAARLKVGVFPCKAGLAGGVAVEEFAGGGAADIPLLGFLTEPDVRGPEDFESPERTEIDHLGVEAADVAAGIEAEG